jgi:hypothetical protein
MMNLPTGWFGTDLPGRRCDLTYCLVPLEELPPIDDAALDGSLAWLDEPQGRFDWAVAAPEPDRVFDPASLERIAVKTRSLGVELPPPFVEFLGTRRRNWVRSPTACWLELPDRLVTIPGTERYAVRFLNDQQGVFFWYLALDAAGDQGVVVSDDLFDTDEAWLEDPSERQVYRCARSFEEFLHRFWLESEVYFRTQDGTPLTPTMRRYLNDLTGRVASSRG